MSKVLKKNISEDLQRRLGRLESYLLVDFRGINSAQSYELRRTLLDVGVRMNVVPNRMAMRVLDRWAGKREDFRSFFRGPTAILHGDGGALTASRVAMQWKKKNKNLLPIKGAVLDGEILPSAAAEGLAKIPDRLTLLGMVAGCLNAPLVRLATATQGPMANLVRVLEAHRKKMEAVSSPLGPPEGTAVSSSSSETVSSPLGPPEGTAVSSSSSETVSSPLGPPEGTAVSSSSSETVPSPPGPPEGAMAPSASGHEGAAAPAEEALQAGAEQAKAASGDEGQKPAAAAEGGA